MNFWEARMRKNAYAMGHFFKAEFTNEKMGMAACLWENYY